MWYKLWWSNRGPETGDWNPTPALHARRSSTEVWARDGGRMPAAPPHLSVSAWRCCPCPPLRCAAQIFIAPVLAFAPAHLGISCHHALTRLALCPLILSRPVSVCHKTRRFWTLPVTMKLNILSSASRFGICKILPKFVLVGIVRSWFYTGCCCRAS